MFLAHAQHTGSFSESTVLDTSVVSVGERAASTIPSPRHTSNGLVKWFLSVSRERELFITTPQDPTGELTTDMAKGSMIAEIGALISTKIGVLDIISAQKGARVSNTTKQRSSMYRSAAQRHKYSSTETQIQQQVRERDNTCSHMYNKAHASLGGYCTQPYLFQCKASPLQAPVPFKGGGGGGPEASPGKFSTNEAKSCILSEKRGRGVLGTQEPIRGTRLHYDVLHGFKRILKVLL